MQDHFLIHRQEATEVVAAAVMPYDCALDASPAGCLCPCGRSSERPQGRLAVDVRVGAVPPSSAGARSTEWTNCFCHLHVYQSSVGPRVTAASLSYEYRTVNGDV